MNKLLRSVVFAAVCMVALQPAAMSAVESKPSKPWLAQRVLGWAGGCVRWAGGCVKNHWKPILATTAVAGMVGYWQRYSIFGYFDIQFFGYTINERINKTVEADYIEFLLEKYGQPAKKVGFGANRESDKALCLCSAIMQGRFDLVKRLVEKLKAPLNERCDLDTVDPSYTSFFGLKMQKPVYDRVSSPIRLAIEMKNFEIARYLRDHGATIDYADVDGCIDDNFLTEFVDSLERNKTDENKELPIFEVVRLDDGVSSLLKKIIARGDAKIIEAVDEETHTPLWHAVDKSRDWAVKLLVESGAKISDAVKLVARDAKIKDYLDFVAEFDSAMGVRDKQVEVVKKYLNIKGIEERRERRKLFSGFIYRANDVLSLKDMYSIFDEVRQGDSFSIIDGRGDDIVWVYAGKLKCSKQEEQGYWYSALMNRVKCLRVAIQNQSAKNITTTDLDDLERAAKKVGPSILHGYEQKNKLVRQVYIPEMRIPKKIKMPMVTVDKQLWKKRKGDLLIKFKSYYENN